LHFGPFELVTSVGIFCSMKKNVLLIDESLTVQKVVALTLDRQKYNVLSAKSRSEAMKVILESPPDMILVSDQVPSINASSFPGEVDSWVGKDRTTPPMVLITSQEVSEFGRYTSVLKKPFSPQALHALVVQHAGVNEPSAAPSAANPDGESEGRLQKIFNENFNDEADLVRQTFQNEYDSEENELLNTPNQSKGSNQDRPRKQPESAAELWGVGDPKSHLDGVSEAGVQLMGAEDSMAYKASLDSQIDRFLRSQNMEEIVARIVERMVPPIVEKIARERIDRLLKEDGEYIDIKA
jgi:DNA-binding response OmpR family regulator